MLVMLLALLSAGEAVVFLGRECVDPGAGAGDSDLRMVILRSTCRPLSLTQASLNNRHFIHRHTPGVKRFSLGMGKHTFEGWVNLNLLGVWVLPLKTILKTLTTLTTNSGRLENLDNLL